MRFCRIKTCLAMVLGFIFAATSHGFEFSGREFDFSGYVETRHCMQVESPNDLLASETMARLETRSFKDVWSLFTSINLSANHKLEDESGISMHEAYIDYVASSWDLRLGRQIIIWGNADGFRITDNISPSDLSEYITRDFDEIRMAVDAVKLRFLGTHGTGELIYIPFFRQGISPDKDSPWSLGDLSCTSITAGNKPEKNIENGELGAKYALFLPGFDMAVSYFYTWNDFPYYAYTGNTGSCQVNPQFYRLHIYGLELSRPYNDFVFRGEAAFSHGNRYLSTPRDASLEKKDQIKWLLGLDWSPGSNWFLSFQVTEDRILDYSAKIQQTKQSAMVTANISKKLFREKLILSGMHYLNLDEKDSLTRLSSEYQVMDGFSLFFGSDIFTGKRSGGFGRYKDNTQVWARAKYSF